MLSSSLAAAVSQEAEDSPVGEVAVVVAVVPGKPFTSFLIYFSKNMTICHIFNTFTPFISTIPLCIKRKKNVSIYVTCWKIPQYPTLHIICLSTSMHKNEMLQTAINCTTQF